MISPKVKHWVFLTLAIGVAYLLNERDAILDYVLGGIEASQSELTRFSRTLWEEYIDLVETGVDRLYRGHFRFYSDSPYHIQMVKSNSKGAALIFAPSDSSEYSYRTTPLEIEAEIFPCRTLSKEERSSSLLETVLECAPNASCYVVNGPYLTVEFIEFMTSGKEWLEVTESGGLTTKNIVVDKVLYPGLIKIKGSTLRKAWSGTAAKRDALQLFNQEFATVFAASEGFRQYLAYPELQEMATDIIENLRKNPDYTMFDRDKDFERLYLTGLRKYGVRGAFVERVYSHVKEKHILKKKLLAISYTNNWVSTAVSTVVIVFLSLLLILFNLLFRVYRGGGFLPLLKELKKKLDPLLPIGVCFLLYQEKPLNATLFQWLAPWIIAVVSVYVVSRAEVKYRGPVEVQPVSAGSSQRRE